MITEKQLAAAIVRVSTQDKQSLLTTLENARAAGPAAAPLVERIEERLREFDSSGGMRAHREDFARLMLARMTKEAIGRRVPSIDLFNRTVAENSSHEYALWMKGNSARKMPFTDALTAVLPEFPDIRREKDGGGQSDRVYFVRVR